MGINNPIPRSLKSESKYVQREQEITMLNCKYSPICPSPFLHLPTTPVLTIQESC